jgi:lipoprotein-anchoring transpeptidase ErfK/SrfK
MRIGHHSENWSDRQAGGMVAVVLATVPSVRRRAVIAVAIAIAGLVALATPSASLAGRREARAASTVAPDQLVATLTADHTIYNRPAGQAVNRISRARPITGEATTVPVLTTRTGRHDKWLLIRFPSRPNGQVGWIKAVHTRLWLIRLHLVVSLGQRSVRVYYDGSLVKTFIVIVGAPSSPTPLGQFFVEENIAEPAGFPGAPYALALSARSNTFTEFDGGPGQIAMHGIENLGGTMGTAESHGCIRFTTADITWLAQRVYPGTPVTITS